MSKPRLIAFYLPQFYPTPENDEWWEPGFTEWTNVVRAKPLFKGHYQPKIPRDLGFYDLRVSETREKQADFARKAGIEGFCYWHYWFGNGKRLLSDVFREVVESGKPDFPFCLCWANHSWYKKTWDPNSPDKLLIEQTYPGVDDFIAHFYEMLPAFKDKRYIRLNGKLLFGIYAPLDVKDFLLFKETWNELAKENGINGFHFFGFTFDIDKYNCILESGYDSVVFDGILHKRFQRSNFQKKFFGILRRHTNLSEEMSYYAYSKRMQQLLRKDDCFIPCIVPNFDHSPRSANRGIIIPDSSPNKWYSFCKRVFEFYAYRGHEENLIFIKAWNEWGEGNYLEPDCKYGLGWIVSTREALCEI